MESLIKYLIFRKIYFFTNKNYTQTNAKQTGCHNVYPAKRIPECEIQNFFLHIASDQKENSSSNGKQENFRDQKIPESFHKKHFPLLFSGHSDTFHRLKFLFSCINPHQHDLKIIGQTGKQQKDADTSKEHFIPMRDAGHYAEGQTC